MGWGKWFNANIVANDLIKPFRTGQSYGCFCEEFVMAGDGDCMLGDPAIIVSALAVIFSVVRLRNQLSEALCRLA